jgi:lipid-A-disaccharide synthase
MSKIAVVAGEASGDARACALLRELRQARPDLRFFGAGGPRMAALPDTDFDVWIDQAAVVGLWDVLRQYGYFRRKFEELRARILCERPAAVILVDYPGFNLRLARALRRDCPELKIIYYISPQVWAWNRRRIPQMARIIDLMLCLFPFEEELYRASGLRVKFVGHPLVEELAPEKNAPPREPDLVGLFPGSRDREVHRIFPPLLEAAKLVHQSRPEVRFQVAAAREGQAVWMRELAAPHALPLEIVTGQAHELMKTAAVGLVCSGTATLEAALLGLPYALVYRVNWLTYEVGRRLVRVPFLGMVNILAGRQVVREFIQAECAPFLLADELLHLLNHPAAREKLTQELALATGCLGGPGASQRAAEEILPIIPPRAG